MVVETIKYVAGNIYFLEINREIPFTRRIEIIRSLKNTNGICKNENNRFYWYYGNGNSDKSSEIVVNLDNLVHIDHLFEYQKQDISVLMNMNRSLLTYDTGLGKTVLSIATLINLHKTKNTQRQTSLIVVPKPLINQWKEQIEKFTNNEMTYHILDGFNKKNKNLDTTKDINIVTYSRLRKIPDIEQYNFFYIIFDEANNVKNASTKQTKVAYTLNGRYKVLLTATPIKNNPTEIYSLFRVLDLSKYLFGTYNEFLEKFSIRAFDPDTNRYFPVGYKNVPLLSQIIAPFCIHRTKTAEIKKQIGQKFELIEFYRFLDMSLEQKNLQRIMDNTIFEERHMYSKEYYRKVLENLEVKAIKTENKISPISLFSLSRILADSGETLLKSGSDTVNKIYGGLNLDVKNEKNPKITELINILEEINNKSIIFTCFSTIAELLNEYLMNKGYEVYLTTGKTENNQQIIENFKNTLKENAVLVSTDVSKYGLNLQFCSNIIHFDLPFTYSELKQRNGRIDRIGQDEVPNVFYLIVKDSVDEDMLEFIKKKKEYSDIITAEGSDPISHKIEETEIVQENNEERKIDLNQNV